MNTRVATHPSKSQDSNKPKKPVWNKNPDWDRAASQEEALHLYETFHEFEVPGEQS